MRRIVYTVQKATFCTEVYGDSGYRMYSGCSTYCNQHSNAYVKVVYLTSIDLSSKDNTHSTQCIVFTSSCANILVLVNCSQNSRK